MSRTWPAASTQDIGRLDVLVNETLPVHLAERRRQARSRDAGSASAPAAVRACRSSGSPPGSSSTSSARPSWRVSARGRTAQAGSSSPAREYSCSSRRIVAGVWCRDRTSARGSGRRCPPPSPIQRELDAYAQRFECISGKLGHGERERRPANPNAGRKAGSTHPGGRISSRIARLSVALGASAVGGVAGRRCMVPLCRYACAGVARMRVSPREVARDIRCAARQCHMFVVVLLLRNCCECRLR